MKTHDFKFMYGTNCLVLGVVARCVEQHQHKLRFTLEGEAAPPPMPPINGLCNSRLCRPHLRP